MIVIIMSFLYPIALIAISELSIITSGFYTFDIFNFIYRFAFSLLIGLAFGGFAYRSKDMLKFKSVRIHIIVWIISYILITIFTPLAWMKIIEMPTLLLEIMFEFRLVYLGEQLIILVGFYVCLLCFYYLKKK
jgi:hypothetical protein